MDQLLYQSIIDQSNIGFSYQKIMFDNAGIPYDFELLEASEAFFSLLGKSKEEVIGKKASEILPDVVAGYRQWIECFGYAALVKEPAELKTYVNSTDKWLHLKVISKQSGFVASFFNTVSQESYFKELFQFNPDFLCVGDPKGNLLKVNQKWESTFGFNPGEMEGKNIRLFIHPEDLQESLDNVSKIFSNDESIQNFTNRFLSKDGSYRYLEWQVFTKENFILASARDMTQKISEKQKIEKLTASLQDFLRMSIETINYQRIADTARVFSGAQYIGFHLYQPDFRSFETAAISACSSNDIISSEYIKQFLYTKWPASMRLDTGSSTQPFTVFPSLESFFSAVFPEKASVDSSILFTSGEAVLCKIKNDSAITGYLSIVMPHGSPFTEHALINIYIKGIGLLLDRIHTEEELKHSRELLKESQSIAQLGTWDWNHAEDTLSFSEETTRLFELGHSPDTIPFRLFIDSMHPSDQNKVQQIRFEQINREPYDLQFRIFTKNGSMKWVNVIGQTALDAEGNQVRSTGIIQDISVLKQAEEKIKELLDQNETIFNGTQNGLFLLQVSGRNRYRCIKCNASFEKITGASGFAFSGKSPEEVFGEKIGKQFALQFSRCMETRQSLSYEETVVIASGTRIWSVTLTPIIDGDKPAFIVGSIQDSTVNKIAEKEIKANLELNKKLLGLITNQTQSTSELLSLSLEQIIRLTKSKYGYIFLYDNAQKKFISRICSRHSIEKNSIQEDIINFSCRDAGLMGDIIRQKKPLLLNDFSQQISLKILPEGHFPIHNLLSLPILDNGHVEAIVAVANKKENYSENDILTLNLVMNNVWSVIDRKRSNDLLKQEKELFQTTLLSIGDAILATDKKGKVIVINEVAEALTGWSKDEALGCDYHDVIQIIHEKTRRRCEPPITRVMESGKTVALVNHTLLIAKDGREYPITNSAAPIVGHDGNIKGVVMALRDVTVEKQKMDAIRFLSYHDQLTGIYNRSFFEEEIKRLNTKRNLPISFVLADVNCLKLANDAFGHSTGDKILKKTARIIQNCCRQDDILARIGGDEFAMILPQTTLEDAEKIVERIKTICQKTHLRAMSLSVSFGTATKELIAEDIRLIQKKAEDLMYKNKMCESPAMRNKTIQFIIQSLYTKYDDEKDHSMRVCRICEAIGKEMALSERELDEIKNAALLHDIGKIAINSNVLNKSSQLNETEWSEIQRHPEVGYRLLRSLNDFSYISECILAHHEKFDGSGYPKGLQGNEIPLQTRIIALAEAYDAMTNERIYKKAMTKEDALGEITRNAGSQFDPDLVSVFLKIFKNKPFPI